MRDGEAERIERGVRELGRYRPDVPVETVVLRADRPALIAPQWYALGHGNGDAGIPAFPVYPEREGNRITPLVCGENTFAEIHGQIEGAEHSVHIALWSMQPGFRLRRDPEVSPRLDTIGELLIKKAADDKLDVRVLLWAVVPGGRLLRLADALRHRGNPYYRDDWKWYEEAAKNRVQIRYETHPAGPLESLLGGEAPGEGEALYASHHQKLVVVDGRVAFVMGMNMRATDWDTEHNRVFEPLRDPGVGPRRDLAVRLEGPCVADVVANFRERWARGVTSPDAGPRWREDAGQGEEPGVLVPVVEGGGGAAPESPAPPARQEGGLFPRPAPREGEAREDRPRPLEGGATAQVCRTWYPGRERGVEEVYFHAVVSARHYIYVENQYFRHRRLAEAMAARVRSLRGDLAVVVVMRVPGSPVERAPTREAVEIVRAAFEEFGAGFEPYCLVSHETRGEAAARVRSHLLVHPRPVYRAELEGILPALVGEGAVDALDGFGAVLSDGQRVEAASWLEKVKEPERVYYRPVDVHTKALLVDDYLASVGSANVHRRSLEFDSELNVTWTGFEHVRPLRVELWRRVLGKAAAGVDLAAASRGKGGRFRGVEDGVAALARAARDNLERMKQGRPLRGQVMPLEAVMEDSALDSLFQLPAVHDKVDRLVEDETERNAVRPT